MKTRIVHTRFWKDEYVSNLTAKEKLLFLYLLTNECVNMCGIYELPDKYICVDLGLTLAELEKAKEKFQTDKRFYFDRGWIKIFRHEKYNSYGKGMQEKALAKEKESVPDFMSNTSIDTSMDTSIYTRPNIKRREREYEREGNIAPKKSVLKAPPLSDSDLEDLAKSTGVALPKIKFTYAKVLDYEKAHGKFYKDYKAATRNFLRNDLKFNQGGVI